MNGMGVFACGASKISAGYKQYLSSRIRKVGCAEVRDFFFEKNYPVGADIIRP